MTQTLGGENAEERREGHTVDGVVGSAGPAAPQRGLSLPRMARLVPGRLVGRTSGLAEFLSPSSHSLPRAREVKKGMGFHLPYVPRWRNGRRRGLKILRAQAHAGSSP